MNVWIVMEKLRLSTQAKARGLLARLEKVPRLTKEEAQAIQHALDISGVQDASTKFAAGFSRAILKAVACD